MEEEILACIKDEDIKYLESGQISKYIFPVPRKRAHQERISHLIVRLFVVTVTPEKEVLYLVQKRGKRKKGYPEHFTDSASGHVVYEENMDLDIIKANAIRELEEEFGIPEDKIQRIIFKSLEIEKNHFTGEIAYIFYAKIDYNVILSPNSDELEIEGSQFYNRAELEDLLEKEKAVDYSKKIWKSILRTEIRSVFEEKQSFTKNKEIALFIGRFQPFHKGHLSVLKEILKEVHLLKIGIGSSQLSNTFNDPFTAEERKLFITNTLTSREFKEKFEVYEIPDIFNAKKWVEHVLSITGPIDIVFSNSEWVRELFHNRGYSLGKKMLFEFEKYNGSKIRTAIAEDKDDWNELVPKEVYKIIIQINGIERLKRLKKSQN